jgi:hypothetical protein
MVLNLTPDVENALKEQARQRGIAPEDLALQTLQERFQPRPLPFEPRDEWERRLLAIAIPCGVSLPDSALSSDGLYE